MAVVIYSFCDPCHGCLPTCSTETQNVLLLREFLVEVFVRLRHSVCNLSTKEHKSKSAAITQTGNRVQNLAGVRNETKSSESKFGKAQVSIC